MGGLGADQVVFVFYINRFFLARGDNIILFFEIKWIPRPQMKSIRINHSMKTPINEWGFRRPYMHADMKVLLSSGDRNSNYLIRCDLSDLDATTMSGMTFA